LPEHLKFYDFPTTIAEIRYNNMAEDGSGGLENFFPPPPPFYKYFTSKNLDRLKKLQEGTQAEGDENKLETTGSSLTKQQTLNLPTELRYLIPPEVPVDGKYRSFGEWQDVSASEQQFLHLRLLASRSTSLIPH
jgi:hypothetical protein